jgi:hypothetical protein
MPAHVTPRNLRGDAKIDLDGQRMELRELLQELHDGKASVIKAIEDMIAHVARRTVNTHRLTNQIDESLRLADEAEQTFFQSGVAVI